MTPVRPTDFEDTYGLPARHLHHRPAPHAYHQPTHTTNSITELESLGMAWDKNEATRQRHTTTVKTFHATHGLGADRSRGKRVMIGPRLCKVRAKLNSSQLLGKQSKLMRQVPGEDRTGSDPSRRGKRRDPKA